MDALFTNVGTWLVSNGAGGVVGLLAVMALIVERRERTAERKEYRDEIEASNSALVDTLNRWRTDSQMQSDKVSALAEKVIIAIESSKRG